MKYSVKDTKKLINAEFIRVEDNMVIDSCFNMYVSGITVEDMLHLVHNGSLYFSDDENSILLTLKRL